MKLSLNWLFDHLTFSKKDVSVSDILQRLNAKTAEIDSVESLSIDSSALYCAQCIDVRENEVIVECAELKKKLTLPLRKDAISQQYYFIKRENQDFRWATLADAGATKEGLFPAIWIAEGDVKGEWRKHFESEDTILTIDNIALTNRPDLWSHRGFAREIAALFEKELVSEEQLYATIPIKHDGSHLVQTSHSGHASLSVSIDKESIFCGSPCRRLAVLSVPTIERRASLLPIAMRLVRVDSRPIDSIVDFTNYVMFDIGQPMHAFDAQKIVSNTLTGRCARDGEKITLLDGDEVELKNTDFVIADAERALAVAGIMGGTESSVSSSTHSVLLEAANFEPLAIRRTSTRLKKRTESSARFEKSLDPNQNTQALLRYIKLLDDYGISYSAGDHVYSLGALRPPLLVTVSHELIEERLGIKVMPSTVERILKNLGFGVEAQNKEQTYVVTVPTVRATKDITRAEDLIEEIARFVGYSTIVPQAPVRLMKSFDLRAKDRLRALKALLAYGLNMREVSTYALYDEEFLRTLNYDPSNTLRVANPISEHWQRLITTLVPNLLKCVKTNIPLEHMRFFECNRVWFVEKDVNVVPLETQELAGIWYERSSAITFYDGKAMLEQLFDLVGIEVVWKKFAACDAQGKIFKTQEALKTRYECATDDDKNWYDLNQSAELWYGNRIIGRAGKISPVIMRSVVDGDAFIFELDANFLLRHDKKLVFTAMYKYPVTDLDISMLVPLERTVDELQHSIKSADDRIESVELVDSFEKPEWKTEKSITMRFIAADKERTLTKEDIDAIWDKVVQRVKSLGAQVR